MPRLAVTPAAVLLLVGNLVDAVITLTLLQLGLAREMNPLLLWVYESSPLAFVVGKLSLVQLSLLLPLRTPLLWPRRLVVRGGAILYGSVVVYQLLLVARMGFSHGAP